MQKLLTDRIISPDNIIIPEWHIFCHTPTTVGIYTEGKLYFSNNCHPWMWGKVKSGFDFRVLPTGELVYWGSDYPWSTLKKIKALFDKGQYTLLARTVKFNLNSVLVNEKDGIARYTFDELDQYHPEVRDNLYERERHLMSPRLKRFMLPKEQVSAEYKESCNYWKNKIGNLDVAEWHLLKYQE